MRTWVWAGVVGAMVMSGGCDRDPPPTQNSMDPGSGLLAPNVTKTPGEGPVPIPYPNVGAKTKEPGAKTSVGAFNAKASSVVVGDGGTLVPLPGLTSGDGG